MYFGLLSYLVPFFIMGAAVIAAVLIFLNRQSLRSGTVQWRGQIYLWLSLVWFLGTSLITLMPFAFGDEPTRVLTLIPFEELVTGGPGIGFAVVKEGLANVLLFVAGGFLFRLARRTTARRTVLALAVFAIFVETGQYVLNIGRMSSIDDVIWAIVGATVGATVMSIYALKPQRVAKAKFPGSRWGREPLASRRDV